MKRILTILLILLALLAGWQAGKQHTIKSLNPFVVDLPDRNEYGGFTEEDFTLYIEIDGQIHEYDSAWHHGGTDKGCQGSKAICSEIRSNGTSQGTRQKLLRFQAGSVTSKESCPIRLYGEEETHMRINIVINDQTIMEDINLAIENLLDDNDIRFPSEEAREEFEQECFEEIADTYENNSAWDSSYLPTWDMIQAKVQDAMYAHEYNTTT